MEAGKYPPIPPWLFEAADTITRVAARPGHHLGGLMAAAFLAGCDAMRATDDREDTPDATDGACTCPVDGEDPHCVAIRCRDAREHADG